MHPVAIGMSGELIVTGAGVSKGYWNLPALTTEKFIPKNSDTKSYFVSLPVDNIYTKQYPTNKFSEEIENIRV